MPADEKTNKPPTNLANFAPDGALGELFAQAKNHNHLNQQLQKTLPKGLETLTISTIQAKTATFTTSNSAIAYRAKKQTKTILISIQKIPELSFIQNINIIVVV